MTDLLKPNLSNEWFSQEVKNTKLISLQAEKGPSVNWIISALEKKSEVVINDFKRSGILARCDVAILYQHIIYNFT